MDWYDSKNADHSTSMDFLLLRASGFIDDANATPRSNIHLLFATCSCEHVLVCLLPEIESTFLGDDRMENCEPKKRKRRGKDKSDGVSSGVAKYFISRFKMSISVRESYQSWLQVRVSGLPTAIKKSELLSR